jgi:ATP-dependent Clp protease ATP-binding subunit ClpA
MLRPTVDGGALARFTRDLTSEARAGRLDPIRCRAAEIDRVVDILLRHGKNNPALVGPAGVGKTAIVEGLAHRTAAGQVPLALRGIRILSLDHVALLAGTTYRGQYEERLRVIVAECSASHDAVLFIDELHNLIGQGTAMGTAMDAANMLKPALVRGDFRVIGATTDDEYERWVCGDPALERRFQKITVRELSGDETMEILRARRATLERHHGVMVADDALDAALRLTDQHVTDRMRPDRALDVLDEACAHAQATAAHSPAVEALLEERRRLVRGGRSAPGPRADVPPPADARTEAPPERDAAAASGSAENDDDDGADRLERFARDGFAAIERFGAELEAMFAQGAEDGEIAPPPAPARRERPSRPQSPGTVSRLAEIEVELGARLAEEGTVVRGVDVARVVAIATGREVKWPS